MSRQQKVICRRAARKLISLSVLLSMCMTFAPMSVGRSSAILKDKSIPFPCQDRPCGCGTAEQCWRACCCFSHKEKIDWARKNGVTPPAPETLLVDASSENAKATRHQTVNSRKQLSRSKSKSTHLPTAACGTSGCELKTAQRNESESASPDERKIDSEIVILTLVQHCRGQGPYWYSLPPAVLAPVVMTICSVPRSIWLHPTSVSAPDNSLEPAVPPPLMS